MTPLKKLSCNNLRFELLRPSPTRTISSKKLLHYFKLFYLHNATKNNYPNYQVTVTCTKLEKLSPNSRTFKPHFHWNGNFSNLQYLFFNYLILLLVLLSNSTLLTVLLFTDFNCVWTKFIQTTQLVYSQQCVARN